MTSTKSRVVVVQALTSPLISPASPALGSTAATPMVASSARNARPKHSVIHRQRSLGTTEDSQPGRSRWNTHMTSIDAGIAEARPRLR